jgi:hypothetical protein
LDQGGGGGEGGPPCSGDTPSTALHFATTQCKPRPSLPLQKDAIVVEEVERQLADRILERLNGVGEQRLFSKLNSSCKK